MENKVSKEVAKAGFDQATKELREKQIQQIKQIVMRTLEEIKKQEKARDEAIEILKTLKMDLDDLKMGRIDRIEERQREDESCRKNSVVVIEKEKATPTGVRYAWQEKFFEPYKWSWNPNIPGTTITYCNSNTSGPYYGQSYVSASDDTQMSISSGSINGSIAKDSVAGVYKVSGEVIHVR
jgi:hypothetical protein